MLVTLETNLYRDIYIYYIWLSYAFVTCIYTSMSVLRQEKILHCILLTNRNILCPAYLLKQVRKSSLKIRFLLQFTVFSFFF